MYTNSIFIFGSDTVFERKLDAISSLPLELSWKIFSYLDDASLRTAARVEKTWKRIISADKKLMSRLSLFELGLRLGSHHLARFHRKNRRKVKMLKQPRFISIPEMFPVERKVYKSKRGGDEIVVCAKRFKLI